MYGRTEFWFPGWLIIYRKINPRFKETKMNEDEKTEGTTEVRVDGAKKEPRPTQVNVNIWEADSHYLASFNHAPRRVFHNVEELLVAIEVEVKRLGGTLGDG